MYQEYFIQKGTLILPIVAMLSFVLSFVAILLWSLRSTQSSQYADLALLPLSEQPGLFLLLTKHSREPAGEAYAATWEGAQSLFAKPPAA